MWLSAEGCFEPLGQAACGRIWQRKLKAGGRLVELFGCLDLVQGPAVLRCCIAKRKIKVGVLSACGVFPGALAFVRQKVALAAAAAPCKPPVKDGRVVQDCWLLE